MQKGCDRERKIVSAFKCHPEDASQQYLKSQFSNLRTKKKKKKRYGEEEILLFTSPLSFFSPHIFPFPTAPSQVFFCTISDCASLSLFLSLCLAVLGDHVLSDCSECVEQLSLQPCLHHQQVHMYLSRTESVH